MVSKKQFHFSGRRLTEKNLDTSNGFSAVLMKNGSTVTPASVKSYDKEIFEVVRE
jgi:hypothetical protein